MTCPGFKLKFSKLAQTVCHIWLTLSCPTYQLLHEVLDLNVNAFKPASPHVIKSFWIQLWNCVPKYCGVNKQVPEICLSGTSRLLSNLFQTFTEHSRGAPSCSWAIICFSTLRKEGGLKMKSKWINIYLIACCPCALNQTSPRVDMGYDQNTAALVWL